MAEGRKVITFSADATETKKAAKEAIDSVKNVEAASKDGGLGGAVQGGSKFIGVMSQVVGKVAALGAAFMLAKKSAEVLFELMSSGLDRAKDKLDKLDFSDKSNVKGSIGAVQKEIDELEKTLGKDRVGRFFSGDFMASFDGKKLEDELKSLRETRRSLMEQDKAQKDREKQKADADAKTDLRNRIEAMKAELGGPETKARYDALMKLRELQKLIDKEQDADRKRMMREQYNLQVSLNTQAVNARIEADNKAREDQRKKDEEERQKKLDADKKAAKELIDFETRLREEQLGSIRNELGDLVSFGRGGSLIMQGGER